MFLKKFKSSWWPEVLFLTIISALVYLPRVGELSFHSDDWYFIYNGLVLGPKAFIDLTLHTRPIRGPLYQLLFSVYGLHPLPYNLTLYFWRLLGGLGALWLFNLLWSKQRQGNFFLTVLFLLFPGFVWWVSGFEFQPYVLSLTLQVFSILFTLKALETQVVWKRVAWMVAAIVSGWVYLALVEFAIGMEAFRILAVFLFLKHSQPGVDFKHLALRTFRAVAIFLVIPFGFVFWYQFLFDNWRKAQQASVQLAQVFKDPSTLVAWVVGSFQGLINVAVMAWTSPFNANFYLGQPYDFVIRFALAAVVIAVTALAYYFFFKTRPDEQVDGAAVPGEWQAELIWLGLLGTLAGVLPVVLANRSVTFGFSQYGLPASLAGVLLLGGFIYSIFPKQLSIIAFFILIGIASLTHQALASRAVEEEKAIYNFWWQVSWRAPSIRPRTTLLAQYPFDIGDTDSLVWGPANFIYYPEKQSQSLANVQLYAITDQPETIPDIMVGASGDGSNLVVTNSTYHYDYQNLLVISQAGSNVCARVVDSDWPLYSTNDRGLTVIAGPYSVIGNILPDALQAVPPQPPFGAEPPHTWCYYYEKADLARQQGNWAEVARLGDEAVKRQLHPNDAIEWLPFLQGYANTGNIPGLDVAAKPVRREPYYRKQACAALQKTNSGQLPLSPAMLNEIDRLFCGD